LKTRSIVDKKFDYSIAVAVPKKIPEKTNLPFVDSK
jgi:hypothetical protein